MASEKITAIIDEIKGLSILELKELIDTYCEEFGVSAAAPVAVAAAPAAGGAGISRDFNSESGALCMGIADVFKARPGIDGVSS